VARAGARGRGGVRDDDAPTHPARRRKGVVVGAVALGVAGLLLGTPGVRARAVALARAFDGRGRVTWQTLRWQALQNAKRRKSLLVVYRVDPRHPDPDLLRRRILVDPAFERVARGLAWHWAEEAGDPGGLPAAPELELWDPDDSEPVFGPVPVAEVTAAQLLAEVRAAAP